MQNLINELMAPTTNESGETVSVSTVKRRAAEALVALHTRAERDTQARLVAERQAQINLDMLEQERVRNGLDLGPYKDAMNKEYYDNFT